MNRAEYLLKSVRLKPGGHDHLIISQLKEVQSTFTAFIIAQSTLSENLTKWSSTFENEAMQRSFLHLAELNALWAAVQKDLLDGLRAFRHSFKYILEEQQDFSSKGEAGKFVKEVQKSQCEENQHVKLDGKLSKMEKEKEFPHIDVDNRLEKYEATGIMRLKESLGKVGHSYWEMGQKASIIFKAHLKVSQEMPTTHHMTVPEDKCRDNKSMQLVQDAKEQLRSFYASPKARAAEDLPPPYSTSMERLNDPSLYFSYDTPSEAASIPREFELPSIQNCSNDSLMKVTPVENLRSSLSGAEESEVPAAKTRSTSRKPLQKKWSSTTDSFECLKKKSVISSTNDKYKLKQSFSLDSSSDKRTQGQEGSSTSVTKSDPSSTSHKS